MLRTGLCCRHVAAPRDLTEAPALRVRLIARPWRLTQSPACRDVAIIQGPPADAIAWGEQVNRQGTDLAHRKGWREGNPLHRASLDRARSWASTSGPNSVEHSRPVCGVGLSARRRRRPPWAWTSGA